MTRLAIVADIHGNLPALDAVIQDLAQFEVERVIVAGDVINWGPFSEQVLETIAREGWRTIRGNNELYLLDYATPRAPTEWADSAQYSLLPWLRRQLEARWQREIATWPDTLCLRFPDAPSIRVVHGVPSSPWKGLRPDSSDEAVAAALATVEEDTVVAGHTHLPMDRRVARWRVLNPGSVGVPLQGRHAATYMLLDGGADGWAATLREVPFDVRPVLEEFERQSFEEECGVIGRLILEEFRTARIQLVPFLVWRDRHRRGARIDARLLDEFLAADAVDCTPPAYRLHPKGLEEPTRSSRAPSSRPAAARDLRS